VLLWACCIIITLIEAAKKILYIAVQTKKNNHKVASTAKYRTYYDTLIRALTSTTMSTLNNSKVHPCSKK